MEAILQFLEWIGDIFVTLFEVVMNIGNWLMGAIETIAYAVTIPTAALDIVNKLTDYFPVYLWTPILALLSLVIVFRVLKIVLSGGD